MNYQFSRRPQREASDAPRLDFIGAGYFQDSNRRVIREDLVCEKAEDLGRRLASRGGNDSMSSSQLRRFYHDVKALEAQVVAEDDFTKIKPMVKMLKSKAAYARGRSGSRVPRLFEEFIQQSVDTIQDLSDFKAFLKVFEAVVGYFYGAGGGSNQ